MQVKGAPPRPPQSTEDDGKAKAAVYKVLSAVQALANATRESHAAAHAGLQEVLQAELPHCGAQQQLLGDEAQRVMKRMAAHFGARD